MEPLKIIETEDGSSTIYNSHLRETYHSTHGAITESIHVFIKNGLEYYKKCHPDLSQIQILEIGFGTGLNAFLAFLKANEEKIRLYFETIEAYPLELSMIHQLNYYKNEVGLRKKLVKLHELEWNTEITIDHYFTIKKILQKLEDYSSEPETFDIIFYDAFAPGKQPELWEKKILGNLIKNLKMKGIFVTYSAKGQLQRDLKELGCEVEKLAGPPRKKEMIRATKIHKPGLE